MAADASPKKDFDIDKYIKEDKAFSYPVKNEHIKLQMMVDAGIAQHLEERPLAPNQTIKVQNDGRSEVVAQVSNTQELRWWLLGFGNGLEVVGPKSLRDEMKETSLQMHRLYSS